MRVFLGDGQFVHGFFQDYDLFDDEEPTGRRASLDISFVNVTRYNMKIIFQISDLIRREAKYAIVVKSKLFKTETWKSIHDCFLMLMVNQTRRQ